MPTTMEPVSRDKADSADEKREEPRRCGQGTRYCFYGLARERGTNECVRCPLGARPSNSLDGGAAA